MYFNRWFTVLCNRKYFYVCLLLLVCGCGISHRESDVIITDINGFFTGFMLIESSTAKNNPVTISVEAALVQTATEIYGTISGAFTSVYEEVLVTGTINGALITIYMEKGVGPVTLTGMVQERSFTLKGNTCKNAQPKHISLYLQTDRIAPLRKEFYM